MFYAPNDKSEYDRVGLIMFPEQLFADHIDLKLTQIHEVLEKHGLSRDMKVTHWGWYYPVSNFVFTEEVKTRTMTGVMHSIARLIWAYENKEFNPKFFFKTCQSCSYFGICEGADTDSWL